MADDLKKIVPTKFLWIDLEMTGLDVEHDVIVEVGAEVTDLNFVTLASYEAVIHHDEATIGRMNDWALAQHSKSGLVEKIRHSAKSDSDVQHELIGFIKAQFQNEPAVLAGNSIHNDREFIKKYWPNVNQLLHYRMLDVSSFKIIMMSKYSVIFEKNEDHRAFDDIQASIAELQFYLDWLKHNSHKI